MFIMVKKLGKQPIRKSRQKNNNITRDLGEIGLWKWLTDGLGLLNPRAD